MTKELQTLNERIAERVGKELIDLMPEGEWQKLVDQQLSHFKTTKAPQIINEMIAERMREQVRLELDKYAISDEWNQVINTGVNKAMVELIADNGAQILAGMLSPVMQQVAQDFRNRMGY